MIANRRCVLGLTWITAIGLVLAVLCPLSARAQSAAHPVLDLLAKVDTGTQVRLGMGNTRVEGSLLSAGPDGVRLRAGSADSTIALVAIDALWIRGSRPGRGFLIGALITGVPSGVLCALDSGECDVVIALPIMAIPGGLIGLLIGSAQRWHRRYPPSSPAAPAR